MVSFGDTLCYFDQICTTSQILLWLEVNTPGRNSGPNAQAVYASPAAAPPAPNIRDERVISDDEASSVDSDEMDDEIERERASAEDTAEDAGDGAGPGLIWTSVTEENGEKQQSGFRPGT